MHRLSGWRRIADAMWGAPNDPQIYGSLDVDATNLASYLSSLRAAGHHVTVTHLVGHALAHAIARVPEINVRLLRGYAVPRRTIDIFFISAVDGGHDLSGVRVDRANEKSVIAVARELDERARSQKQGRDPDLARAKRSMQALPKSVLRAALRVSAFLASDLDLGLRGLGLTPSPFGSAMVSSVGMFGLPTGFAPISWMYRVPVLLLVGEMSEKPVVVDGNIVARTILPISATIDHRYVDGWHVSKLLDGFKGYLADPRAFA